MDSHIRLALALDSHPGAVALLLGAGISASAGVLTAWEIRQDLIQRVATAAGEGELDDPEAWWAAQNSGTSGYDDLLAALAPTPAGRRDLLRGYFEPNDDERDRGEKVPGPAHRAVARLVTAGKVKVVLTINFDRLIEAAIREAGVEPVVVSSPEAVRGMEPLQHQQALVVHLHGDYLSPETLNTPDELSAYDPAVDALLDEVFDRYGLVVAGWSAKWDVALRARLQAARSPRYGTWWLDRAPLKTHALDLCALRGTDVVIGDAAEFLGKAADAADALAEQRLSDPVTRTVAVSYARRALSGRATAVPLHDTLRRELDRVAALPPVTSSHFEVLNVNAEHARRLALVTAGTGNLLGLVATSAYWGDDTTDRWWARDIANLAGPHASSGITDLIALRDAPSALLLHAAAISACAAGRNELVARLAMSPVDNNVEGQLPAAVALHPNVVFGRDPDPEAALKEHLRPVLQDELALGRIAYEQAWDRWTILRYMLRLYESVNQKHNVPRVFHPLLLANGHRPTTALAAEPLRRLLQTTADNTGLLAHSYVGGGQEVAKNILLMFEKQYDEWAQERSTQTRPGGVVNILDGVRYPGRPHLTATPPASPPRHA